MGKLTKDSNDDRFENDSIYEEALDLLLEEEVTLKRPHMYSVIMLNDDYTPMDFVVFVLKETFHKTLQEAAKLMLAVHHQGRGHCGVYTREVADEKIKQVHILAEKNQHPLHCIMEIEDNNG